MEASLAYYHDLLFYKGHMTEDQLLSIDEGDPYTFETVGYGPAHRSAGGRAQAPRD